MRCSRMTRFSFDGGLQMDQPLVSVIIPAYNCAGTIGDTLESVLRQRVSMEILVINDCSPDQLDETMAAYRDNPCIVYLKNGQNLGASGSRNKAVAMAKGKYVAFVDSDDQWAADKLEKQVDALEATGAVLCCTARELLTPEGKPTGRIIPVKPVISYRELLKHNSINCSSVLIPAEIAREFPMEHEDSHEDYITWLKVLRKYGNAVGINEPLLKYRLTTTGKSGNKLKSAAMTYKVYRYMGFNHLKSLWCFASYAANGVAKYLKSYLK